DSFLYHRIPLRLELSPGFPFWEFIAVRDLVTDVEEQPQIVRRAGQVPIRIHLVGWLVIMLRHVFILLLLSKSRRLADDVAACACVERWKTYLRKFEIIGAIKSAFLRLAVRVHDAALFRGRSREHVVEIGIAEA